MSLWSFIRGTTSNLFGIGDGVDSDKAIEAQIPGANKPKLRFNVTTDKWEICHDGTTFSAIQGKDTDASFDSILINLDYAGTTGRVVNVYYGTGAVPDPAGIPDGSLYIQYTA